VLTTPRRPQYLRETLHAIDAAGGFDFVGRKVVFVDGPAPDLVPLVPGGWIVLTLTAGGPSRGTRASMREILRRAAEADAPYLLYFEDDVRLARNAVTAMAAFAGPSWAGFLSFMAMNPGTPSFPGVHRFTGPMFWGTQAIRVPLRSLLRFVGADDTPAGYPHACDVWLGQRLVPGIVIPSIVRHIGAVSSIPSQAGHTLLGEHSHRAGLFYAGDLADALQVLR